MQFLKDEIKEKIVTAAKKLFIKNGYENTSMQLIAKTAGITAGNIYRYFKGKEMLLEHIVRPIEMHLDSFINAEGAETGTEYNSLFDDLIELLVAMCEKYSENLNILFNCVGQRECATYRERILISILKRMKKIIDQKELAQMNSQLSQTITETILEGIYKIINAGYRQTEELKRQLKLYTYFMCKDFDRRLFEAYQRELTV